MRLRRLGPRRHPTWQAARRVGRALLPLAGYLAASLYLFQGLVGHLGDRALLGGTGDPGQAMWFLRWVPHALAAGHNPLFSDAMYAPDGLSLLWNPGMPLPGLLTAPVTLTAGAVTSYNLLLVAAPAVSAWAAYGWLTRHVRRPAAFLGGLLYGFSPFVVGQSLGHLHLTLLVAVPVLLVLLEEVVCRDRHGPVALGVGIGLLAVAQLLTGEEVLVLAAVTAALGLAALAGWQRREVRRRRRRSALALAVAAGVAAVLAGPVLALQFFGPHAVHGAVQGPGRYVADAAGFVTPSRLLASASRADAARARGFRLQLPEEGSFLGWPLLVALLGVTVLGWRRPFVRVVATVGVVLAVLSLGPRLQVDGHRLGPPLPWAALDHLPALRDLLPVRFSAVVALAAGALLAVGVDAALRRGWRVGVLGVLAGLAVLVPLVPLPSRALAPVDVPAYFRPGGGVEALAPGTVALVLPLTGQRDTQGLLWQQAAGMRFRQVGGYGFHQQEGGNPTPLPYDSPLVLAGENAGEGLALTPTALAQARTALAATTAQVILVGPGRHRDALLGLAAALAGGGPSTTDSGGVAVWRLG